MAITQISDKSQVHLRRDEERPLEHAEGDGNFIQLENVIDDVSNIINSLGLLDNVPSMIDEKTNKIAQDLQNTSDDLIRRTQAAVDKINQSADAITEIKRVTDTTHRQLTYAASVYTNEYGEYDDRLLYGIIDTAIKRLRDSLQQNIDNVKNTLHKIAVSGNIEDSNGNLSYDRISNKPRWMNAAYDENNVFKLTSPTNMNQIVIGGEQFKLQLNGSDKFIIDLTTGNLIHGTVDQSHVANLGQVARDNSYNSLNDKPALTDAALRGISTRAWNGLEDTNLLITESQLYGLYVNSIKSDNSLTHGFINGNVYNPYTRHGNGTVVELTRQAWANEQFEAVNKSLSSYVNNINTELDKRVVTDGIGIAGFMGGDSANSPYFRTSDGKTVVALARLVDLDAMKNSLGSASTKSIEYFDVAGSAETAKNDAIGQSVVRDSSRRAGFISGNKFAPYIEYKGSDGSTEIVELARQSYLGDQLGKLSSMAFQSSDAVNIIGGNIDIGKIISRSNDATYRLINGTSDTSYGSFMRMDPNSLHLCLTGKGDSLGSYNNIPISVSLNDGTVKINKSTEIYGGLEIFNGGGTPFIDFHFGGSTADYTTRIIETSASKLEVYGEMSWTKPRQTLDNLGFDVNKQAKGHQQIGKGGIIIQWGSWSSPARGAGQWTGFDVQFPSGCMGVVVGVGNAASQMSGCNNYNNGGFTATTGNEDPLARSGWYIAIGW